MSLALESSDDRGRGAGKMPKKDTRFLREKRERFREERVQCECDAGRNWASMVARNENEKIGRMMKNARA